MVACLIFAAAGFVIRTSAKLRTMYENIYCGQHVADLIISHLDSSNRQWPENWEDLADDYNTLDTTRGMAFSFDKLKSTINVDWCADPTELIELHENGIPSFVVISSVNGSNGHIEGREPNQLILNYLLGKY